MIPKVCALALISVILSAVLKEFGFKGKGLFSTLCLIIILSSTVEPILSLISTVGKVTDLAGIGDAAKSAIRAVGLGYVFGFTSDVCSSLGEGGIASAVLLVGKIEIFMVSMPFFEKIIALGVELLG